MLAQLRDKSSKDENKELKDQARKAVYYTFGNPRLDSIEVKEGIVYFYIDRPWSISQPGYLMEKIERFEHPEFKIVGVPKLTISTKFEIWDNKRKDFDFTQTKKFLKTYFENIGEIVFVIPNEIGLYEKYDGGTIDIASEFPDYVTDFKLLEKDKEEIIGFPGGYGEDARDPDELIDKTYSFTVITSKKTKKVTQHIVQKIYND